MTAGPIFKNGEIKLPLKEEVQDMVNITFRVCYVCGGEGGFVCAPPPPPPLQGVPTCLLSIAPRLYIIIGASTSKISDTHSISFVMPCRDCCSNIYFLTSPLSFFLLILFFLRKGKNPKRHFLHFLDLRFFLKK